MSAGEHSHAQRSAAVDAREYVPRRATEDALAALASFLRVGATRVALRGPSGIGKTMLLRVVGARLEGRLQTVYISQPEQDADQIAPHVLDALGESEPQAPERHLVALARKLREQGSGLAILVDDAAGMPLPTARRLSRIAAEARPAISLVLAVGDDAESDALIEALESPVETVDLREPMTLAETRTHIRARFEALDGSTLALETLDESVIEAIHREAEGNPGAVERCAQSRIEAAQTRMTAEREAEACESAPTEVVEPDQGLEAEAAAERVTDSPSVERRIPRSRLRTRAATAVGLAAASLALAFLVGRWSAPGPVTGADREAPSTEIEAAPAVSSPGPSEPVEAEVEDAPQPSVESSSEVEEPVEATPTAVVAASAMLEPEPAPAPEPIVPVAQPVRIPVSINAVPWARIEVDGEEVGVTPLADLPLIGGPHAFRATFPDGRVIDREEEISAFNRRVLFR